MSPHTRAVTAGSRDEMQDQEVLRAYRELAAYFKGQRTEREARAALKIVRAFVKERERIEPNKRRPLPGLAPAKPAGLPRSAEKTARTRKARRRRARDARPEAPVAATDIEVQEPNE